MAPAISHVHKLVVRNVKLLKAAWKAAQQNLEARLPRLEPIPIPVRAGRQPLHPVAALKQARSGWNGSSVRHITTSARGGASPRSVNKSAWPTSATRTAVSSLSGRAPFASTLRPNLTGGTLNRTAGGYSLGSGRIGGARHFSHTPAAPAQVVQNVSQAIRAFLLSGQKAQFAGTDARTGEKQYKAVTSLQDSTSRRISKLPTATPGSYVDFVVNPTITALTPLSAIAGYAGFSGSEEQVEKETVHNLNTSGLLDVLSVDFSRALKDLAAILNDLKALSALGDLPITYRTDAASTLRVHFPGCDADTVENLCRELGVKRGLVVQDEDFDAYAGTEIALLFPFAPSDGPGSEDLSVPEEYFKRQPDDVWDDGALFPSPQSSTRSESGYDLFDPYDPLSLSSPEAHTQSFHASSGSPQSNNGAPLEYQDWEGIYRFIELCDDARR